jgi:hypothetical protein
MASGDGLLTRASDVVIAGAAQEGGRLTVSGRLISTRGVEGQGSLLGGTTTASFENVDLRNI